MAMVPQRPHLFPGSVRENIAWPARRKPREMERAAELAGAAAFVERLPRGYETPVGERGARLSGGEAQRIAIARAFLKDAPLLMLDEPTSSLDPTSEALVREALERLSADRTVLVVAHRLNTVYTAEHIAVLEQGRVVERGRHDELLAPGRGLYRAGRRRRPGRYEHHHPAAPVPGTAPPAGALALGAGRRHGRRQRRAAGHRRLPGFRRGAQAGAARAGRADLSGAHLRRHARLRPLRRTAALASRHLHPAGRDCAPGSSRAWCRCCRASCRATAAAICWLA